MIYKILVEGENIIKVSINEDGIPVEYPDNELLINPPKFIYQDEEIKLNPNYTDGILL